MMVPLKIFHPKAPFNSSFLLACLFWLHHLLSKDGEDAGVTELLNKRVIYLVPRLNPDGAELALADKPRHIRSSTRPYPWDEPHVEGLTIEDMDGDAKYGCRTMPIVWGVSFSKVFVSIWMVILLVLLIVVMFYVLQFRMWIAAGYNLVLIILPAAYVLYLLFKANQTKDFALLSKWIKAVIFTGIVSMILFKFFA